MDRRIRDLPVGASASVRTGGVVRWFCPDRGFGFIVPDDGSQDAFVSYIELPGDGFRALHEGQRVTFERSSDGRGPTAHDVRLETA